MDYSIKINEFEGPLDLLLHLIKQSNISIYDIDIFEITNQYLDYINKMEELNINVAASYLVMAAELMEIKSKSLLPTQEPEEEQEDEEIISKEALINKLVEYQKYKDMIDSFKTLEESRREFYTKDPINFYSLSDNHIENDGSVSVEDLALALSKFLERKELEKPIETKITMREISVEERSRDIKNILKKKKKVSFFDLFEVKTREYVVVTFLSILEMAKNKEIVITQDNNFNEIYVSNKEGEKND